MALFVVAGRGDNAFMIISASKPNGSVPHDAVDDFPSSYLASNHRMTAVETQAQAHRYVTADSEDDDDDTVNGSPKKAGEREEDRETEEDTVDEEDNEKEKSRSYFRSGSESSLSCQAQEQEVHVQIEDQGEQEVELGVTSREQSADSATNTPVQTRRPFRRREDRHAFVPGKSRFSLTRPRRDLHVVGMLWFISLTLTS